VTFPAVSPAAALITPSSWVYYAQRAVTGAWLDRAGLPLSGVSITWDLAADALTGTIDPAIAMATAIDGRPVLDEWSTLLYAVADGAIRWGGILTHSDSTGPAWQVQAVGFRGYPPGMPYLGPVYKQVNIDPLDVIRALWAHLQSYPAGNLHVTVDSSTHSAVRVGTTATPYELDPWNAVDVGSEISTMLAVIPAEMTESHAFAGGGETVTHTLSFSVPRAGRRRDDLRFAEDENVAAVIPLARDGTAYANGITAIGTGTGSAAPQVNLSVDDGRLRRVAVYQDQHVTTTGVLKPLAQRVLAAKQNMGGAAAVVITNHPNAPLGSVAVGDDILVQFVSGWAAGQAIWHRVTAVTLEPQTGLTTLTTARSDSFSYTPTA
jgi:hypothetical protein